MVQFEFSKNSSLNEEQRFHAEWLETNGLGGWANSTIAGYNTRRYHGLLVAAIKPPTERSVLVSKLDETLIVNNVRYELGVNDYGNAIHPNGYQYLKSFRKDLFPQFLYEAGGVQIRKSILMLHMENTTIIKYEVLSAPDPFRMEFLPLMAVRGYHQLMQANDWVNRSGAFDNGMLRMQFYQDTPMVSFHIPGSDFVQRPDWFFNFNYSVEAYRGLDFKEDLFTPGYFGKDLNTGDCVYVILTSEENEGRNAEALFEAEQNRRKKLVAKEKSDFVRQLVLAADQFIVKRNEELKTIIAGYPWFTDWARDTMISLTGLTLCTKRFDDARKILAEFAQTVDKGMLPNRFQDNGEAPEYNDVDGTLFYFVAIYEFLKASKDKKYVLENLLPVLKEIIEWHFKGTRFNIHVDHDGLLYAGEQGYQLTWMDARIGDWVVTPRIGKPVEIQALWYNALCIYSELLSLNKEKEQASFYAEKATAVKEAFLGRFWNKEGQYLYDNIGSDDQPDATLRPNQLLAISLPFPLVEGKMAKSIMKVIETKLYTPKGLRSLSPDDVHYISHYGGDQLRRDAAYHQGTVWSWLLGPYIDAIFRTNGSSVALTKAKKMIRNFLPHLEEAGIGTVSEIFDAEPPFAPRGCIAQAWGVAELLRVIKTYQLDELPEEKVRKKPALKEA